MYRFLLVTLFLCSLSGCDNEEKVIEKEDVTNKSKVSPNAFSPTKEETIEYIVSGFNSDYKARAERSEVKIVNNGCTIYDHGYLKTGHGVSLVDLVGPVEIEYTNGYQGVDRVTFSCPGNTECTRTQWYEFSESASDTDRGETSTGFSLVMNSKQKAKKMIKAVQHLKGICEGNGSKKELF